MERKNICHKGIVLNRMYAGDYLYSNLGHEVINMYRSDNGNFYLYLNSHGNFAECHRGKVGYMILVKYHSIGSVEVVGVATGLQDVYDPSKKESLQPHQIYTYQEQYIMDHEVTYGKKELMNIFDTAEYQNIFITYKAEKVWKRNLDNPLLINFGNNYQQYPEKYEIVNIFGKKQAKTSLKQYVYHHDDPENYKRLIQGVFDTLPKDKDNNEKWNVVTRAIPDQINVDYAQTSIFDICSIKYSENSFSNALEYFMKQTEYRDLWSVFFAQLYNCNDYIGVYLNNNYIVQREVNAKIKSINQKKMEGEEDFLNLELNFKKSTAKGRIDLLINDSNYIVLIENKIKSDINSIKEDDENGQLKRYWEYAQWLAEQHSDGKKRL